MTRQELDLLCQPLSPEEVLAEMNFICNGYVRESGIDTEAIALKASCDILNRVIEYSGSPPSVRAARIMF